MTPVVRNRVPASSKGGNDSTPNRIAKYVDPQTIYTAKNARIKVPERDFESVCMSSTITLRGKSFRFYPHSFVTLKTQTVTAVQIHAKNHIGDTPFPSHNPLPPARYYNYVFEDRTLPPISTG